jgi:elongation factor P--beta-lysine ligase
MKFQRVINEIQQTTLDRIDHVVMYLKGQFLTDYPQFKKVLEAVRPEVLIYKRKGFTYFGVQVVCTTNSYEQQRINLKNTIRSLQVTKDNNAELEMNDKMLKILFKEVVQPVAQPQQPQQPNTGVQA